MECYYAMTVLYDFENVLKSRIEVYESNYRADPTDENALTLNTAIRMLLHTYRVGVKYGIELAKLSHEDSTYGRIITNFSAEKKAQYENLIKALNTMDDIINTKIEYLEQWAYNSYINEFQLDITEDEPEEPENIVSPEELQAAFEELLIQSEKIKFEDTIISENYILEEDIEIEKNLYVDAPLNLNGHTLTIHGDLRVVSET